jgi:TRAP transporter TAXI family solute receptor
MNVTVYDAPDQAMAGLLNGDLDVAAIPSNVAAVLYNKTEGGVQLLWVNTGGVLYLLSNNAESVSSLADLKGKTVSVGDAGSGVEFNAKQILEAYDMTFDDINVVNASFGDSADSLKDGKIDAAFIVAGAPTTAVVDLATTKAIHLVQLDEEHIKTLQDKYDFYTATTIPAGTYDGVEEDATTVSVRATLIASNNVSEDAIYELLKAMFDNQEALIAGHAKFEFLNLEDAVKGISVPFHAGAKKYYEEQGITVE